MPSWQRTTLGFLTKRADTSDRGRTIEITVNQTACCNIVIPSKIIGTYTSSSTIKPSYTFSAGFETSAQSSSRCLYGNLQTSYGIVQLDLDGHFTVPSGGSTLHGWTHARFRFTRNWVYSLAFSPSATLDTGNLGYIDVSIPIVYPLTMPDQQAEIESRTWSEADFFEVDTGCALKLYTREIFLPKVNILTSSATLSPGVTEWLYDAEGTWTTPDGTGTYPASNLLVHASADTNRLYLLHGFLDGVNRTGTQANFAGTTNQWTEITGVSDTHAVCAMEFTVLDDTTLLVPANIPLATADGDIQGTTEMVLPAASGHDKTWSSEYIHTPKTEALLRAHLRRMRSGTPDEFHGRFRVDYTQWNFTFTGLSSTSGTVYHPISGVDPSHLLEMGGTRNRVYGSTEYFTPGAVGSTFGPADVNGQSGPDPRRLVSSVSCEQVDELGSPIPGLDPFALRLFPTFEPVEVWRGEEKHLFPVGASWVAATSTGDTDESRWWGSSPPTVTGGSVLTLNGPVTVHYNFAPGWESPTVFSPPRYRVMPSPTLLIRMRSVGSDAARVRFTMRGPVVWPRQEFLPEVGNANDIPGLKVELVTGADGVWVEREIDLLALSSSRPGSTPIVDANYDGSRCDYNEFRAVALQLRDAGTVEIEWVKFLVPEAGLLTSCYPRLPTAVNSNRNRNDLWNTAYLHHFVRGFPAWHQQWRRNAGQLCCTLIVQLAREVERVAMPSYATLAGANGPNYLLTEFTTLRMAELLPPRSGIPRTPPFTLPPFDPGNTTFPWRWTDLFTIDASIETLAGDGMMVDGSDVSFFIDVPCGDTSHRVVIPAQYALPVCRIYPGAGEIGNSGGYPDGYGVSELIFWAVHGGGAVGSIIDSTAPVPIEEYREGWSGGVRFVTPPRDAGDFALAPDGPGMPDSGEHASSELGLRGISINGWDDAGARRLIENRFLASGMWPASWQTSRGYVRERFSVRFWKSTVSGGIALAISRTGRIVVGEIDGGNLSLRRWDGLALDTAVVPSTPADVTAISLLWREGYTGGSHLLAGIVVSGSGQIWRSDDEGGSWTLVTTLGAGTDVTLCSSATGLTYSYRVGTDARLYMRIYDSRDTDLVGEKTVVNSSATPLSVQEVGLDAIWDPDREMVVLTYIDGGGTSHVATSRNGWELLP